MLVMIKRIIAKHKTKIIVAAAVSALLAGAWFYGGNNKAANATPGTFLQDRNAPSAHDAALSDNDMSAEVCQTGVISPSTGTPNMAGSNVLVPSSSGNESAFTPELPIPGVLVEPFDNVTVEASTESVNASATEATAGTTAKAPTDTTAAAPNDTKPGTTTATPNDTKSEAQSISPAQTPSWMSQESSSESSASMPSQTPAGAIGSDTNKDKYLTGPVPDGKPLPVEPEDMAAGDGSFIVTLSVRCDTLIGNIGLMDKEKRELVPEDGVIFPATAVVAYDGESAFNVLQRELKRARIHMEFRNTPIYNSAYIVGINNLYELDAGDLSGWMYCVNGWYPNYGYSRYLLEPGDVVEFRYTCDLGRDLGQSWVNGGQLYDE